VRDYPEKFDLWRVKISLNKILNLLACWTLPNKLQNYGRRKRKYGLSFKLFSRNNKLERIKLSQNEEGWKTSS
jgi:hypothetical protein